MVTGKKSILVVLAALAVTVAVHADMRPAFGSEGTHCLPMPTTERAAVTLPTDPGARQDGPSAIGLDLLEARFIPPTAPDASETSETPTTQLLTERYSSFDLCLCALMGVGLCRTAPWVKKLHLGVIPDWYHSGGPLQIGHSHAVGPDCLCQAAICFVQPDSMADNLLPEYYSGDIRSLLRKSQFIPTVLASRGPPSAC